MEKIFKSKLFYLLLIVVTNACILISFCLLSTNKKDSVKDYYYEILPATEVTNNGDCYKVQIDTIYENKLYEVDVVENENIYSTVFVDSVSVLKFEDIKKGNVIGKKDGVDIKAEFDSYVCDISNELGIYKIDLYNYNCFSLKVTVSEAQYAQQTFSKGNNFYLNCDEKDVKANFVCYDISSFKTNGKIYAIFNTSECKLMINKYSDVCIKGVSEKYKDSFYIESQAFDNGLKGRTFIIIQDGKKKYVVVYCQDIVDGKAIIRSESDDYTIKAGDLLYVA